MKFQFDNFGGRKFLISIFGILSLIGYGISCIKYPVIVAIATPFCAAVATIVGSFCAVNALNDYTAMKKETNGTVKTSIS